MKTTRYRRTYLSQYLVVILALILIVGLGFLSHWAMQQVPYEDQFVIPWAAGRSWLLEGVNPYDQQVIQLARSTLANAAFQGQMPQAAEFTEPVLNLVFSLPLSLLPYEIARTIWVVLLLVSLAGMGFLMLKLSKWKTSLPEKALVVILLVTWLPGLQMALMGSATPIVLALLLFGIDALLSGKDTLAGFLLALTFGAVQITFLILLLLVLWVVFHRRWSILVAYFSGLGFLWIVSLIILPAWPSGWLGAILNNYFNLDWIHTPLMALSGVLPGISQYLSIGLHIGFAIYLLVVWIASLNSEEPVVGWRLFAILNLAFLFQPENPVNQLYLTLPALFLAFRFWSERWGIVGRVLSWLILLGAGGLPWLIAEVPLTFTSVNPLTGLVVGLPLVAMAALISVRWWALNLPRLAFERG